MRLSRLFWFTVLAGGLSSVLWLCALMWVFRTQAAFVAHCLEPVPACGWQALLRLYRMLCAADIAGTLLLFALAYSVGRRLCPARNAAV